MKIHGTAKGGALSKKDFGVAFGGGGGGAAINDADLKSYWKFNEASGDILNSSESDESLGSGAALQVTGAAYKDGSPPVGNSMHFDGVNDFALAGSSLSQFVFLHDVGAKWSQVWWAKWGELTGDRVFGTMSTGAGYRMRAESNGSFEVAMNNAAGQAITSGNNTSTNYVPAINTWYFFCFRWDQTLSDSQNFKFRRNDDNTEYLAKTGNTPTDDDAEDPATFAKEAGAAANYDNVYLSEFSCWDKILSAEDETSLYNSGNGLEIY